MGDFPVGNLPNSHRIAQGASSRREHPKAPRPAASKEQQHKAAQRKASPAVLPLAFAFHYHGGPEGSVRGLSHVHGEERPKGLTTAVPRKRALLGCTHTLHLNCFKRTSMLTTRPHNESGRIERFSGHPTSASRVGLTPMGNGHELSPLQGLNPHPYIPAHRAVAGRRAAGQAPAPL